VTRQVDATTPDARAAAVGEAVAALRRGAAVVVPTESVYAVMADAFSARGLAALAAAKGRGDAVGLPVAVGSLRALAGIAVPLPAAGQRLVRAFWPGPLTVVARQQPTLVWTLGTARDPLSVRMPLHPLVLAVLAASGPSVLVAANGPGGGPPTTLDDALAQLGRVGLGVDAGRLGESEATPLPSTAVDVRADVPVLVRQGAVPIERLRAVVPELSEGPPAASP
jgi:tRNA threonylcarbamoyl adenosine modification protein (Sua5/YciO/YrdC/YwlC family)